MSADICIFRRIEKKYLLTTEQHNMLLSHISPRLTPDIYGKSTICSLYLDTPDFRLIRASIDAKTYKEKLRLRSYGTPTDDSKVFLEIKKKYKGVVYKRRVSMSCKTAMEYIRHGEKPFDSQIMREIDYSMRFYENPQPMAQISYEREAFFVKDLPALRLTFDTGVRYRMTSADLRAGADGKPILPPDRVLLEVKTDGAMPLWLSAALDSCRIYPTSFSKYGTAYREICQSNSQIQSKGEMIYA